MLGIDNAGKSTIINDLKGGKFIKKLSVLYLLQVLITKMEQK